jgi:hypothetical protein
MNPGDGVERSMSLDKKSERAQAMPAEFNLVMIVPRWHRLSAYRQPFRIGKAGSSAT